MQKFLNELQRRKVLRVATRGGRARRFALPLLRPPASSNASMPKDSFTLAIQARVSPGVLTLTLPKIEDARPRRIPIG